MARLERSIWEIRVGLSLQKYVRSSFNLPFCLGCLVRWGVSCTNSKTDRSKRFNYCVMLETRRQGKLCSQECLLRRDMYFLVLFPGFCCYLFRCFCLWKLRWILVSYPPPSMQGKPKENMKGEACCSCTKSKVQNSPSWLLIPLSLIAVKAQASSKMLIC